MLDHKDSSHGSDFSIIIPAYNEEEGILEVLTDLCQRNDLLDTEIIVVDDGSTDRTGDIVSTFQRVKYSRHPHNRGYSSAIKTGIKISTSKYVIWFDADGQHRTDDLIMVADTLKRKKLDYCIGVRDAKSHRVFNRRFGKFILKLAVTFAAGRNIGDFNSGLRGFKREVIMQYLHLLPKGFGASTTTSLLMVENSHVGEEVPITVLSRTGKSSVRQIRDGLRTLMLILRIFLIFKPLHFFGGIGGLSIFVGSIYGISEAIIYRLGFPVFAAILIIFGIQSLFFGLLCDQISALRRERLE